MRVSRNPDDGYRAVVRELRKRAEAGWHPIETAPRDGTVVLLAVPTVPVLCGAWMNSMAEGDVWPDLTGEADWFSCGGENLADDMAPTHWMRLPEPPQ